MASLVERLRHCSDNTRDEYLHELTGRAADRITALETQLALADLAVAEQLGVRQRNEARITALEAMCETLAGALEPFARAKHYSAELNKLKPEARTKPRDFVVSDEFKDAAEALTQYRAMKEKNDG